ncbi:hypothetical protein SDC9_176751 [bioreactor metagenome]|uniref:Uncharacterized protein n=1 Tax=bioreactor metagenome TaxID=1076179 RepID=A0A645GU53_9ZZZZ
MLRFSDGGDGEAIARMQRVLVQAFVGIHVRVVGKHIHVYRVFVIRLCRVVNCLDRVVHLRYRQVDGGRTGLRAVAKHIGDRIRTIVVLVRRVGDLCAVRACLAVRAAGNGLDDWHRGRQHV